MKKKIVLIVSCFLSFMLLAEWTGYREQLVMMREMNSSTNAFEMLAEDQEDPLLLRIQEEAKKRSIAAIEPKVDRVWKLTPGYNGLEVDIMKTYERTKADGSDQLQLVYREVAPSQTMDQFMPSPMYRGNAEKPMVALMINVAWGDEFIEPMLNTLDAAQAKATFFLDGKWLASHVDMAREIQRRGHQLENHGYSHKDMSKLGEYEQTQEIKKTQELLQDKLAIVNKWFAPPSGDFNMMTVAIAHRLQLKTVLWTLDTIDWRNPAPWSIVQKIQTKVEAGNLILMHPTSSSSQALPAMIEAIKQKGLVLGTVDEIASSARIMDQQG